jgi:hypothetical protein
MRLANPVNKCFFEKLNKILNYLQFEYNNSNYKTMYHKVNCKMTILNSLNGCLNEQTIKKFTVENLKEICKEKNYKGFSKYTKKDDLVKFILSNNIIGSNNITKSNKIAKIKSKKEKQNKNTNKMNSIMDNNNTEQKTILGVKPEISVTDINARIKKEVCYKTLEELTDTKLLCEYKDCNSVKNEIKKLSNVLEKYIDEETKQKIIQEYLLQLIPAGTKGVIRGNKFNTIVKQYIIKLDLDPDRFDICFEKKCEGYFTSEIPDWYILEKSTNKVIIGMNQLDLWSGGQQLNRGSKYIDNNKHNTEHSKLLCVVCNEIQFKSNKNKVYKLFEIGFENNTLCYLNNLQNIITSYFS